MWFLPVYDLGRCVDVGGSDYKFTKYYYAPDFSAATAEADCLKVTPNSGTAGVYTAGC